MAVSLYAILAREAPRAVILRRGGTDRVRLILWHTDTDELELGQWFKGRIHGSLSDLSPDGSLFIYAAGKWSMGMPRAQEYGYAWTAISRPPYLTALALWPAAKPPAGSIYDGGGLFVDDHTVLLDHRPELSAPHPEHLPGKGLRVTYAEHPHFGFLDPAGGGTLPMELYRLIRDGWRLVQRIEFENSARYRRLIQPWVLERPSPDGQRMLVLRDDHSYVWGGTGRRYALREAATSEERALEGVQWADWDHTGRLVFSRAGELLVCSPGQPVDDARLIADFSAQRFEEIAPPDWATRWPR